MQVDESIISWVMDYLTGRLQFVWLHGCVSEKAMCSTGATQGTVLVPLLFSLYTSEFRYNRVMSSTEVLTMVVSSEAGRRSMRSMWWRTLLSCASSTVYSWTLARQWWWTAKCCKETQQTDQEGQLCYRSTARSTGDGLRTKDTQQTACHHEQHTSLPEKRSTFINRLIHLRCIMKCHAKSFLHAAI